MATGYAIIAYTDIKGIFYAISAYFVTLRILSRRIHLSTEKPRGATAPADSMIISRIPHSTTKKSKRLNRDMKYALGPRAYIFTNISMTNSTSSTRLATSVEMMEEMDK